MIPPLRKYRHQREAVEMSCANTRDMLKQAKNALQECKEDLEERQAKALELQIKLKKAKEAEKQVFEELKAVQKREANFTEKIKQSEKETKSLSEKIRQLEHEEATLQKKISNVRDAITNHEGKVSSLTKNGTEAEERVTQQRGHVENLQQKPPKFILLRWLWMLIFGWSWRGKLRSERQRLALNQKNLLEIQGNIETEKEQIENLEKKILGFSNELQAIDKALIYKAIAAEEAKRQQWSIDASALPLNQTRKRSNELSNEIKRLETEIDRLDIPVAKGDLANHEAKITDLENELRDLERAQQDLEQIERVVSGFADVGYPILPLIIRKPDPENGQSGAAFLLDPKQTSTRKVRLPDLNINMKRIDEAQEIIDSFDSDMVFVTPDEEEKGSFARMDSIFGVEKRFKKAIEILIDLAKESTPQDFHLPIMTTDNPLGQHIMGLLKSGATGAPWPVPLTPDLTEKINTLSDARSLVTSLLTKAINYIDKIDRLVQSAENELTNRYFEATDIRNNAAKIGTEMLKTAHENSILVRYHFYCPKCNAHPDYINETFNIQLDDIGHFAKLTHERTKKMLRDFRDDTFHDAIGRKMDEQTKRTIAESWETAFSLLDKMHGDLERDQQSCDEKTLNDPLIRNFLRRSRKLYIKIYREIVFDLLLNPRVEFNNTPASYYQRSKNQIDVLERHPKNIFIENTKMQYFPDTKSWQCPNCENTFDQTTALLGAVNKIRKDIEIPVLTTLWNNDEIWKQTVNLIENVSREIRNRWQQETDSLLTPISEYKDDIRELRSRIEESLTKGKAAQERLLKMADDFQALGIIPENEALKVRNLVNQNQNLAQSVDKLLLDMRNREDGMQELPSKISRMRETPPIPQTNLSQRDVAVSLFVNSSSRTLLNFDTDEANNHAGGENAE